MLKIVNVPNSVLTTPARQVKKFDSKLKKLIKEMSETLEAQVDPQGVGLAAPQVGVSLALFITKPTPKSKIKVYINPKIIQTTEVQKPKKKTNKKSTALEGCLSIPRIWSPLGRPQEVELEYQNISGETKTETFKKFDAIIIQHEVDHLHGVLFTQRALEQKSQLYEERDGELKPITF